MQNYVTVNDFTDDPEHRVNGVRESRPNEIVFKTEFRGAAGEEFCIDCLGQFSHLKGKWPSMNWSGWKRSSYTFLPSEANAGGIILENEISLNNDLSSWRSTAQGSTPFYHSTYDVVLTGAESLPAN